MKSELDITQSRMLIKVGIPAEKASIISISCPVCDCMSIEGLNKSKTHHIFKLEDLLSGKILPKEFEPPLDGRKYTLMFYWESGKWVTGYSLPDGRKLLDCHFEAAELIDALYELTTWWRKMFFSHTFKMD